MSVVTINRTLPNAIQVTLSWDDIETAAWIGMRRTLVRLRGVVSNRYGATLSGDGGFDPDVHGALVEFAVAQHFNLHWRARIGVVREVDVGGCIEAKSIRRGADSLLLHPESHDHLPYVLGLVTKLPVVELRGWLHGCDGKRDEYWRDPVGDRPAYFVPQSVLRPMAELKPYLRNVLGRFVLEAT